MTVHRKEALLRNHSLSRLRLVHAAFVDSYPIDSPGHRMSVNRLLFMLREDGGEESFIRDSGNGAFLPMLAGHVYFVPCNHVIDIHIAPRLEFLSLQFNLDLFYGLDIFDGLRRCVTLNDPALTEELKGLLEEDSALRTLCRVSGVILDFCALHAPGDSPGLRRRLAAGLKYGKVLDYIRAGVSAADTVAKLAELTGVRQDVFSRKFTRDMGVTPKDFISGALLRRASDALLKPGATVRGAAAELGFSSEYYFSHFFKRLTGVPPSVFQRQNAFSWRAS
jgi:AraC-like DNA-binding protein